jgi:hypothetical protein
MDVDKEMIRLLLQLSNGSTLRDTGVMLLTSDAGDFGVDREPVQALCDFGFLQRENGTAEDGNTFATFKLTEKARRLIEVQRARQCESDPDKHFWIVVANGDVFIDKGESPPNLSALIGEDWNAGDRIVITCHDPRYVRVADLRLALAGEVYGGLSGQEIDEIEKMATDRSSALEHSRT